MPSIRKPKFLALVIIVLSILAVLSLIFMSQAPQASSRLVAEFEGNYYMGDGLGASCVFRINPDATFKIIWGTDTGFTEEYVGSISVENMQFVLTPMKKVDGFAPCFYRKIIPLKWGKRKYLLPDDELSRSFCENVKSGKEPRNRWFGYPYVGGADINISVKGFPRKPNGQIYCPSTQ